MAKQHNLEPIERARNAGWQAAYHMTLTDPNWDDTDFKLKSIQLIRQSYIKSGLLELITNYESAKRAYLTQQQ